MFQTERQSSKMSADKESSITLNQTQQSPQPAGETTKEPNGEEKGNEKGGEGAVMEYTENEVRSRSQDVNKYSYRCLRRLDIDFFSSPRLIVRGIWRGDVLELQAKRRVEGTWVEWIMRNMTENSAWTRLNI